MLNNQQNRKRHRSDQNNSHLSMETNSDTTQLERNLEFSELNNQLLEARLENTQFHSQIQNLNDQIRVVKMEKEQFAETIINKNKIIEELVKENDALKEHQKKVVSWNKMEPAQLWDHLSKVKKVCNPIGNVWNSNPKKTKALISLDGLNAADNTDIKEWQTIYSMLGFAISGENPLLLQNYGISVFYYEVNITSNSGLNQILVGLSDGGHTFDGFFPSKSINSYTFCLDESVFILSGVEHTTEWPGEENESSSYDLGLGNVIGCGILLGKNHKISIFFTFDGMLLNKPIPINPSVDVLYPTISINHASLKANFGDNLDKKPFKFSINNCPDLTLE